MDDIEAYHKIREIYNQVRTAPSNVNKYEIYKKYYKKVQKIAQEFMCYGMISSFGVREAVDMFLSLEETMMEDRARYLSERYNELPIGTVVDLPFAEVVVTENKEGFGCNGCFLIDSCEEGSSKSVFGACGRDYRTDMKNVIFKLKKKRNGYKH